MSVDLYLIHVHPDDDFDSVMATIHAINEDPESFTADFDARNYASLVLKADARYHRVEYSAEVVAKAPIFGQIILLDGKSEDGSPLAQFAFQRLVITIHLYRGTTTDELNGFIDLLCRETGMALVDPQTMMIERISDDATS